MIYTPQLVLTWLTPSQNRMGRACDTYRAEEKCRYCFDEETCRKEPSCKT